MCRQRRACGRGQRVAIRTHAPFDFVAGRKHEAFDFVRRHRPDIASALAKEVLQEHRLVVDDQGLDLANGERLRLRQSRVARALCPDLRLDFLVTWLSSRRFLDAKRPASSAFPLSLWTRVNCCALAFSERRNRSFPFEEFWRDAFGDASARLGKAVEERTGPRAFACVESEHVVFPAGAALVQAHQQVDLQLMSVPDGREVRRPQVETRNIRAKRLRQLERGLNVDQGLVDTIHGTLYARQVEERERCRRPAL